MGVPKLAKWLRGHPALGRAFTREKKRVKTLALDLNGLIHPVAQKVKTYDEIAPGVIEEIKKWMRIIRPSQKLIITVDGVAPMAKMVQQRKRRFLAHTNDPDNDEDRYLTIDSNIPDIDRNFISPGTRFMSELHRLLLTELPKFEITTVYSSYLVAGEGEHKLAQLIREDETRNNSVMIHSADADMMMISLLMLKPGDELYVLRDTQYGTEYIDIRVLYDSIRQEMPFRHSVPTLVSVISLIGNDFLPHFPSMRVIERSLDSLWDALVKWNKPLCFPGSIDWNAYLEFLKFFNKNYIPDLMSAWANNEPYNGWDPVKTESYMQLQFKERGITEETRLEWYRHVYSGKQDVGKIIESDVNAIALNFAEGLEFVFRYYTHGANGVNKRWYYAFHDAPLFSDLISVLETKPSLSSAYFGPPSFMTIYEQLAIILPPSGMAFVPTKLLPIYSTQSPLRDLYPKQVWNQKSGLAVFYESLFYLPIPAPEKVSAVMRVLNLGDRTGNKFIYTKTNIRDTKAVRAPRVNVRLKEIVRKQFD